jgi:hypothetical protein
LEFFGTIPAIEKTQFFPDGGDENSGFLQERVMKIQSYLVYLPFSAIIISLAACTSSTQAGTVGGGIQTPSAGVETAPTPSGTFTPSATNQPLRCNMVTVVHTDIEPDAPILQPNTPLRVKWRLRNLGSCDWSTEYRLVFDHGDRMSESDSWPLASEPIPAGETFSLSMDLTVPAAEGARETFFKIRAADGTVFATGPMADTAFGFKITVLSQTSIAQSHTPTLDPATLPASVKYLEDVSVPDGWEVAPDTIFTKTWRVQNTGLASVDDWSLLVFDHGDRLDAPAVQPLVKQDVNAEYGDVFDISVDLISPSSPGDYQAFFKIFVFHGPGNRNGSYAAITLSVKIRVTAPTPVPPAMAATQVVSSQVPLSSGYTSTVSVSCPPGTTVVGGGFSAFLSGKSDPLDARESNSRIFSSHKQGNGWTVSGTNNWVSFDNPETPGGAITLQVIAVCLKDPAAVTTEVEMTMPVPEGQGAGDATAACPAGSVVTGGGFSGRDFNISESVLFGKGWTVSADKIVEGSSEFSVYAVCLSGVSAKTALISAATSFPNEYSGFAQAVCPVGSTPSGGGFLSSIDLDDASIHGQSWVVHAKNMSPTIQLAPLKSYAVCLRLN